MTFRPLPSEECGSLHDDGELHLRRGWFTIKPMQFHRQPLFRPVYASRCEGFCISISV